ncbi:DNA protecting protein DprA [Candidatus Magnetobacterium bavaricum]|uniref:DNA protecting protein DprA n=1 Tax=Candidatus Magnetobacterium bavaricum TaxID=29290 RepID=A0A0F3GKT6_9BACT|nr:DNA protecting protein DprA [Candidatus Magnetobacterium bavaricum]
MALSLVPEVGSTIARNLLGRFGTPEAVLKAGIRELMEVDGVGKSRAENIAGFSPNDPRWNLVDKTIEDTARVGASIVKLGDPDYPVHLRELYDAPVILYVKGRLLPEDRYSIAIVGSRTTTHYGISVTEKLSEELASKGFTIVSGLARGIDTAAHKSALKANGRTIAVLGCGIDRVYPPENKWIMQRISDKAAVITEFTPGTKPNKENFPMRNRLISGLSLGVLVVEAGKTSGALITANIANDQGRSVFAIPGNIFSTSTVGTHRLIQAGAKLVHCADDIISELAPVLKGYIKESAKREIQLNEQEKKICQILSCEPTHIDDIIRTAGIAANSVLTILLDLEIKGLVKQLEGKRFHLIA